MRRLDEYWNFLDDPESIDYRNCDTQKRAFQFFEHVYDFNLKSPEYQKENLISYMSCFDMEFVGYRATDLEKASTNSNFCDDSKLSEESDELL